MKKRPIFLATVKQVTFAKNLSSSSENAEGIIMTQQTIMVTLHSVVNTDDFTPEVISLFEDKLSGDKFANIFTVDQRGESHEVPAVGETVYVRYSPYRHRDTNEIMEGFTITTAPGNITRPDQATLEELEALMFVEEETEA